MTLDVRCKFLLLILVSMAAFSAKDIIYGSLVFAVVCLLSFLLGHRKKVFRYAAVYLGLVLFILCSGFLPMFLQSMLLMIVLCVRMCMPIMLFGQTFLKTTKVGEMVTGLYTMHIPRGFVISFAVAMRFFPTAREEIAQVKDAMSLRGIELSFANLRKRPSLVFEAFMTPLLVRASTVSEELSAASITRGLDNPNPRTSFTKLRLEVKDVLVTLLFASALIAVPILRSMRR